MEVSKLFEVMEKATENIPNTVVLRITKDPRRSCVTLEWHVLEASAFELGYMELRLSENALNEDHAFGPWVTREILGKIKTELERGVATHE